jgi:hypothetical protein
MALLLEEFSDICHICSVLQVYFEWLIWYTGVPLVGTTKRYMGNNNNAQFEDVS